ncbi:MAG: hypothetical protein MJY93_10650 [Fibrobacter sp.]|nr:hypothetical protein [Fibrobacter sp.]
MIKKVFATLVFVASASFAQWDIYPVPEDTKGGVRLNSEASISYSIHGKHISTTEHTTSYSADFRYIFLNSLELSIMNLGINSSEYKEFYGPDVEFYINDPSLGIRYQFTPTMSVFANTNLPISPISSFEHNWEANLGVQFGKVYEHPSTISKFGTEAALSFGYDHFGIDLSGEVAFNIINKGLDLLLGAHLGAAYFDRGWVNKHELYTDIDVGFETKFSKNVGFTGKISANLKNLDVDRGLKTKASLSAFFNF